MSYGIYPDFLFIRADDEIPADILEKLARSCGIPSERVISTPTLDTIYRVPVEFEKQGLSGKLIKALSLPSCLIFLNGRNFFQILSLQKN